MTMKKRKKIRPSEEVFNEYVSRTDGYDAEFDKEPQRVQSLNFDKVKKLMISVKSAPLSTKKWLTLSAVISLLESPKPLKKK